MSGNFTRCTNVTKVQVEKVATLSDKLSAKGDYRSLVKVLGLQWKGVDVSDTDGNDPIICTMNLRWPHIQNSHFLGINIRNMHMIDKKPNMKWTSQPGIHKLVRHYSLLPTPSSCTHDAQFQQQRHGIGLENHLGAFFLPTSYPPVERYLYAIGWKCCT